MVKPLFAALVLALSLPLQAANVGIATGWYSSPGLASNLAARGDTVTQLQRYEAAALAGLDVFIQDGSSFANPAALDAFVFGGGTLIQVPWSFTQSGFTSATSVIGVRRDFAYGETITAINTLDPSSWLLKDVALPAAGGTVVSREQGNTFVDGATGVLEWEDGTALLGYRQYGAGTIVALNVNLLTNDAYPLDAAWSNQIIYNAVAASVSAVPEPASYALLGAGMLVLAATARRRRR